jgi:hypothetical protein
MTVRSDRAGVTVRYTSRQTRTYTIRNRTRQEKTVIIEHPISTGWKLAGGAQQPFETSRDAYRFAVKASTGKGPVKLDVTEEQDLGEPFAMTAKTVTTGAQTLVSPMRLGIEIEQLNKQQPEELLGVKLAKGKIGTTIKYVESKLYRIRNHSDQDREITLEHQLPPDWKLVGDGNLVEGTKDLYRFRLKLPPGKTAEQLVVEQNSPTAWSDLASVTDEPLAAFLASPAVGAAVKAALKEVAERRGRLAQAAAEEAGGNERLRAITEEQARLRANIDKVPRESAAYKRYLEKFDKQETEIEQLQAKIAENRQRQQQLKKEYDEYLKNLSVE